YCYARPGSHSLPAYLRLRARAPTQARHDTQLTQQVEQTVRDVGRTGREGQLPPGTVLGPVSQEESLEERELTVLVTVEQQVGKTLPGCPLPHSHGLDHPGQDRSMHV